MRPLLLGSSSLLHEARFTYSGSVFEREIDWSVRVDFGPAFSAKIALLIAHPVIMPFEFPVHGETIAAKGRPKRSRLASRQCSRHPVKKPLSSGNFGEWSVSRPEKAV